MLAGCTAPLPDHVTAVMTGAPFDEARYEKSACGSYMSTLSRIYGLGQQACTQRACYFVGKYTIVCNEIPTSPEYTAQFWRACKAHDICYWTQGETKEDCDRQFLQNLQNECNPDSPCIDSCMTLADLYHHFASSTEISERSFAEAQAEAADVVAVLSDSLDTEVGPEMFPQIGEGCFWFHRDGKCVVPFVAERIAARRTAMPAEEPGTGSSIAAGE